MGEQRKFDIIVWGATGFTGKLVAENLTHRYGADGKQLRWTIAGRNQEKLEQVRATLSNIDPAAKDLPLLIGNSKDEGSMRTLAAQTQVMCTTVGPYARYGSELVSACIQEQTDYCDLTGEVPWIREMIDQHHEAAQAQKTRIVNCCGFDSIPSDLGCLMMQQAMQEQHDVPCDEIKAYVGKNRSAVSGGTIASMLYIMELAKDRETRRLLIDPYSLNPKDTPKGPDSRDQMNVRWDRDLDVWTSPFVMAGVNSRIVRRSNALLDFSYGKDFRYSEVTGTPRGLKGWWRATSGTWGLGAFMVLLSNSFSRDMLKKRVLPAPGEGPSKETQEKGYFNIHFLGTSGEKKLHGLVYGPKDPGYGSTAIMLAESAVCLAKDRSKLPDQYGILTPASAMGSLLIDRLSNAGLAFEVETTPIAPRK